MSHRTQDTSKSLLNFAYEAFTLYSCPFQNILLSSRFVTPYRKSYNPNPKIGLGYFPFRSPLLRESNFLSFPPATKMFQFTGLSSYSYVFTVRYLQITASAFPHSEISGSKLTYSSPKHIVVSHVLHRLLMPRHPPYALINLTTNCFFILKFLMSIENLNVIY